MDLKNNQITMGEILKNPEAKAVLAREFPDLMNPMLLMMAKGMSLDTVLRLGNGKYEQEKIDSALAQLKAI